MSFTRFYDDPCRIEKHLQESTGACRYALNTPGTGTQPHFMEDPFIRMEKWGANLHTNFIDINSDLRGITRSLRRDTETYESKRAHCEPKRYPSKNPGTDQSRASQPAWLLKGLENTRWDLPPYDPQKNVEIPFQTDTSTRFEQKKGLRC